MLGPRRFWAIRRQSAAGRLTLNPLAHIDFLGFLMLIFVGFGWGKPVPFNPYNLKNQRWGATLVALAGPLANLVNIVLWGSILKLVAAYGLFPPENLLVQFLILLVDLNIVLLIFNLIPIPPLDGSKFLFDLLDSPKYDNAKIFLETKGPLVLIGFILLDNFSGLNLLSRLFAVAMQLVYGIFLT